MQTRLETAELAWSELLYSPEHHPGITTILFKRVRRGPLCIEHLVIIPFIMHAISSRSKSSSRLGKLPAEIRILVFRNLVVHHEALGFQSGVHYPNLQNLFETGCAYTYESLRALSPEAIGLHFANEVAELFYTENTFSIRDFELEERLKLPLRKAIPCTFDADNSICHLIRKLTVTHKIRANEWHPEELNRLKEWRRQLSKLLEDLPHLKELGLEFRPNRKVSKIPRDKDGPAAYYFSARALLPVVQSFREKGISVKTILIFGQGKYEERRDIGDFFTREIQTIAANLASISPSLLQGYSSRHSYYMDNLRYFVNSSEGTQKEAIFVRSHTYEGSDHRVFLPKALHHSYTQLLDTSIVGDVIGDEAAGFFYANNTFFPYSYYDLRHSQGWAPVRRYLQSIIIPLSTGALHGSAKIIIGEELLETLSESRDLRRLELRVSYTAPQSTRSQGIFIELLPVARLSQKLKAQGTEVIVLLQPDTVQRAHANHYMPDNEANQDEPDDDANQNLPDDEEYLGLLARPQEESFDVSDFVNKPSIEELIIARTSPEGLHKLSRAAFHRVALELIHGYFKDHDKLPFPEINERRPELKKRIESLLGTGAGMQERIDELVPT